MKGQDILRALREAGRSQRDLALHLNLDPPIINKMIKDKRRITSDEADQIREFFGASMSRPNRIAELRTAKGWSQKELAEHVVMDGGKSPTDQMISYLETGKRRLTQDWMTRIAAALGVTPGELIPAKGEANDSSMVPAITIPEIDLTLGAGGGGSFGHFLDPTSEWQSDPGAAVLFEWSVPRAFVESVTTGGVQNARLFIFRVVGDSMKPDFRPGDRVLVNQADRTPSPAGPFVVFDGVSLVIKAIEVVPGSEPLRLRLISANPRYETYERTVEEAHIQGRVIGKWEWT